MSSTSNLSRPELLWQAQFDAFAFLADALALPHTIGEHARWMRAVGQHSSVKERLPGLGLE